MFRFTSKSVAGRRGIVLAAAAIGGVVLASGLASANVTYKVTVQNTTGATANDIHLNMSGTGGQVGNPQPVLPAVQAGLAVNGTGSGLDSTFAAGVANNANWSATFELPAASTLYIASGYWTNNGANIGAINAYTGTGMDPRITEVPDAAPLALMTLGTFGLLALRRRTA